jgi:exosome complex component CSL4
MTPPDGNPIVLPGDLLGTAEEFVPGRGTYEDHGRIYAALMGRRVVDPRDKAVRVDAIHAVPHVEDEELVFARVDEVKSAMAICTILSLASGRRGVPGAPEGTIHISKAKDGYTESLGDEFQPGDIVLARVLQSQPTIKLTTGPATLGVVAARCQVCHGLLDLNGKEANCPRCGNREHRKLAQGFEGLSAWIPAADAPRSP